MTPTPAAPAIAVAPIPGAGLAAAIRDRLHRAAAPRYKKKGDPKAALFSNRMR